MIKIADKSKCCGCSACVVSCPVDAIYMTADKQGFLYPIARVDKCIECGKCEKICPILNHKKEKAFEQEAYLLQNKNSEVLLDSTSGGAFTAIAKVVLDKHGVVFGAAYDEKFNVIHMYVESEIELSKFRNSKYIQSQMGLSYYNVKRFLDQKRYVCFSGTPCQIEGLLNYLGDSSPYLITVDVVCHAVASPRVWKAYLNILAQKNLKPFKKLRFRDKSKYGYQYSQFLIEGQDGKIVTEGIEINLMLRAFFSEICNRPSCYECSFKKRYRRSDITIWDCFDPNQFSSSHIFIQEMGISRMMIQSNQGKKMLKDILSLCIYEKVSPDIIIKYDSHEMLHSVVKNQRYNEFWNKFYKEPEKTLVEFFPLSKGTKTEEILRKIAFRVGIYSQIRTIYKKLFGNRKR